MVFNLIKRLINLPVIKRVSQQTGVQKPETMTSATMSNLNKKPIVWIDCEMTGLNLQKDRLMEIACLVTDSDLNVIAEGPNIVINQPDSLLETMDGWCTKTHTETGLLQQCRDSKVSEEDAEDMVLSFLRTHVKRNEAPLAGNTIYMDRIFLREQMPRVNDYLHYRVIDVSSIKELCSRWNGEIFNNKPSKKLVHRALDDILETIEELKYYRKFMFISPAKP